MFWFKKHKIRRKDPYKSIRMDKPDWQTMKALSSKLKVPMVQIQHDMIMIYSGFILGVEHEQEANKEHDMLLLTKEFIECKKKLDLYIERFGKIEM